MPDWDLTPLPGSARDVTPNLSGTESFRWTPDNHEYRQIAGGGYADDTAGQARFDATAHQAVPGGEMLGNINPDGTMNNGGGDIAKAQASMRAYVAQRQAALGPPGAATAPAPTPAPVYADRAISLGSSAPPVYTTKTPMADPPPTVDRAQPVPQMAPAPMPLTPAAAAAQAAPAAPTADPAQLTTMLSPLLQMLRGGGGGDQGQSQQIMSLLQSPLWQMIMAQMSGQTQPQGQPQVSY